MASQQYEVKEISFMNLRPIQEESQKKICELISNYKTSFLQTRLDFEGVKVDKLKIIVIDKLLRLNFSDSYIAFYDKDFYLLTEDEKNLLCSDAEEKQKLTFIKIQFAENKVIYKIDQGKYFLILNKETDSLSILNFIKWVLVNNEE
jgi:hypothetical protein